MLFKIGCWPYSHCHFVEVNLATFTCWGYYQILIIGLSMYGHKNLGKICVGTMIVVPVTGNCWQYLDPLNMFSVIDERCQCMLVRHVFLF